MSDVEVNVEDRRFLRDWIIPLVIAIFMAIIINKYVIFKAEIPSESMVPTLNVGDQLFITRTYNLNKLKRGDIIVFKSIEKSLEENKEILMIKRLIGLPGDEVSIIDGIVSVNGEIITENYLGEKDNFNGKYKVPKGKYFFLGDNRLRSEDSRYWEDTYIDGDEIKGKAWIRVYPFDKFGVIK